MELLLRRTIATEISTIGQLLINDEPECYILEDKVREVRNGDKNWLWKPELKVPGKTAIPSGRYEIVINQSPRFKRELPLLLNVPDFSGVRIHAGNTDKDTDGCLLPGTRFDTNVVYNSRDAFNDLFEKLVAVRDAGESIFITIRNEM